MKIRINTKFKYITFLVLISVIVYVAFAHSNGSVSGLTSSTSPGCSCHSSSSNSETSVSVVSGTGSFSVDPNSVTSFTITVTNANEVAAGIDIGVKTTQFGETDAGTLSPGSGSGLQNNGYELTHTSPKTLSGGSCSFQFTWTAPSTPGTYYLRAIANAVNLNGSNDPGDHWNWMPVQTITVNAPPGISITAPVGGESWCQNTSHNVTWNSNGIANVKIELSSDGGYTFPTVLTASTSGSSHSWPWNTGSQAVGNTYKVRVSDTSNSSILSASPGNFSIPDVTSITTQPQSQTRCSGQSLTLTVVATGGGLTYSWRKNGTAMPGTNNSNYSIQSLSLSDAGTYDCVVTGTCGSPVTSNQATLTVNQSPAISQQPSSQTVCSGQGVSFAITATATGITYQWRKNAQNISGANSANFIIANTSPNDAGQYDCVVNGACNTPVTSGQAMLTVNTPPQITKQPQDVSVCESSKTTFKVTASGSSLQYQWRKDGINIPNANNDSLVILNVDQSKTGHYDIIITGSCQPPDTSKEAFLNLNTKPSITQQPVSQSVSEGGSIDFTVIATGSNLKYQWSKNSNTISGANSNDLQITNTKLSDSGNYNCSVSNDCGQIASGKATLTVLPPGSGPTLTLLHTTIDFGTVLINTQKDTIFTGLIKNTGTQTLSISSMSFNPSSNEFSLINPPSLPLNIQGDSVAILGMRFSPLSKGVKNIELKFTSNASTNPVLNLTGTGGEISLTYSDTSLTILSDSIGKPSEGTFTILNQGNMDANVTPTINGVNAGLFTISSPKNSPFPVLAGGNEIVIVQYNPIDNFEADADLKLIYQGQSNPQTIRLIGKISPASVNDLNNYINSVKTYPNPGNNNISIEYSIEYPIPVDIYIYDIRGTLIKSFSFLNVNQGLNKFDWNGKDKNELVVPNGIYSLLIRTDNFVKSYKIVILK